VNQHPRRVRKNRRRTPICPSVDLKYAYSEADHCQVEWLDHGRWNGMVRAHRRITVPYSAPLVCCKGKARISSQDDSDRPKYTDG
jgi:hypothetical protein